MEYINARELLLEVRAILRIPPYSVTFNGDVHHAYRDKVIKEIVDRINKHMEERT